MKKEYPQVTYGAVYFRKSNPPQEDWERDYAQAKKDGMNTFRHWFLWGAIETAPGVYDWSEYDRHLELAAQNGMGTVIAEFTDSVPEWFFHNNKHCFTEFRDGTQAPYSGLGVSCATGGFVPGGLCMDNPETRVYTERFLRGLAGHYKGHPGLFGYDVWNECNYNADTCFCEHTQKRFREWLKEKYGTLEALGKAWHRYSFSEWEQVQAPRFTAQYPECLDWLRFRKENFYKNYQWKVSVLRSADPDARITAHGVAGSLDYTYADGNDDWLAASQVESYGLTWAMGRKGTEPWKQWQALDLVRAASKGKIFWHAEMQGGPLWLQPQVIGREKEDGRVTAAEDVRLWNLVSLAGGARGILFLRWRSLLDGPLFSSFGLYNDDGLPNDRSEAAAEIARWANSPKTKALFAAKPRKAGVGIIIHDQIQEFSRTIEQAGPQKFYARCQWGAYRMFFDARIPVDFVNFADIDEYKVLYFAYPIQLDAADAKKLADWVRKGGRLISEGMPGYFGDGGRVGTAQPNNGLDAVFGVTQQTAEFMPDLGDGIVINLVGEGNITNIPGGLFRQTYRMKDEGTAAGKAEGSAAESLTEMPVNIHAKILGIYTDGETAITRNSCGKGTAILVGTFPSEGYFRTSAPQSLDLIRALLKEAGGLESVNMKTEDGEPGQVQVKICDGEDGRVFLWAVNHGVSEQKMELELPEAKGIREILRGGENCADFAGGVITASIPGKDAVVLEIGK